MKTMKSIWKICMMAVVVMAASCYNDYDDPEMDRTYTKADIEAEGLRYISIADLKARFWSETKATAGTVAAWEVDEPLYTRGKVISTDRFGSIYKSVYLYDESSKSAIEVRLNTGNYLFYPAGRELFVRLEGLAVGNYRGMVSIGAVSADPEYSNGNISIPMVIRQHIARGEQIGMKSADTLVVTRENYKQLTNDDLGRLVRFEGVESTHGTAKWGYKNPFPNYFANSTSYSATSAGTINGESWSTFCTEHPTWGAMGKLNDEKTDTYFYGSAWFSYDKGYDVQNTEPGCGNYVVRTSGYAQFRDGKIPADGVVVDLTAILTLYTSASGGNGTYQLILIDEGDIEF